MPWFTEADNHRLPEEWSSAESAVQAALRYRKATRAYAPEEPPEDLFIIDPSGKRHRLVINPVTSAAT